MDASVKYQVLASGCVKDGYNLNDVKSNFSRKFNIKPDVAREYFNNKPKVIKKDLDEATAQKYHSVLDNLGVDAAMEKMEIAEDRFSLMPIGSVTDEDTENKIVSMVCPKCGLEQPKAIDCDGCGIIIEKYEKVQLALQQTELPNKTASNNTGAGQSDIAHSENADSFLSTAKNKIVQLFSRH